jgi:hypothetical protein
MRDDGIVPVICPTCQNVSLDRSKHPCQRHQATLHGVVFDILVWGDHRVPKRKVPPCGGTFLLSLNSVVELAAALPLLVGILALTVRILLLLSGLLAAALLLAGLLARVLVLLTRLLVLLARVLVLVRHSGSPWLNVTPDNLERRSWFRRNSGSDGIVAWRQDVATMAVGTPSVK